MPSLGPLRVLAAPRPLGQTQTCLSPPLPFPPAGEGRAVPRLCAGSGAGEGPRWGGGAGCNVRSGPTRAAKHRGRSGISAEVAAGW